MGLRHIGTGDMLREAVRQDSPAGRLAKPFVAAGQLAPDDIVNEIIAYVFAQPSRPDHFVMDGYPRTLQQASVFDGILRQHGMTLDAVILLVVPDQEIIRRVSGRWSCPSPACKATYNVNTKPPRKDKICDDCQSSLLQRDDDQEETVRKRLHVYHQMHADLLAYYRQQGLLLEVPGLGDFESIYQNIHQALKHIKVPSQRNDNG